MNTGHPLPFAAVAALLSVPFATGAAQQEVPVLEIKFFPLAAGGERLDTSITHVPDYSLDGARERTSQISSGLTDALERGSIYIGDPSRTPALRYRIVESLEHLERIPVGFDHFAILGTQYGGSRYLGGRHICDYVDGMGVKEVWVWAWHFDGAGAESNMAMGTTSRAHFNHGGHGDISNSYQQDDLPVCRNTYTVYDYNYARGVGEALENHGHQLEHLFKWVDGEAYDSRYPSYGRSGEIKAWAADGSPRKRALHCGNVHFPPNGARDYDWSNRTEVLASCDEWPSDDDPKPLPRVLSCEDWGCGGVGEDGGAGYKVWLMQRYPGSGNRIRLAGRRMRNWWEFVADFDAAVARGRSFFEPGRAAAQLKLVVWHDGEAWQMGTLALDPDGGTPVLINNAGPSPAPDPLTTPFWWLEEGTFVLGGLSRTSQTGPYQLVVYWRQPEAKS